MGKLSSLFRRQGADSGNRDRAGNRADNTVPPETRKRCLRVDSNLTFGHKEWITTLNKETIVKEKKNIDKLLKLDPYPSDSNLALFALRAYWDYPDDEHKSPELPEGWKLLTTARNTHCSNGYFGAAFWCPARQQVVVAHRGTRLTNPGALWADARSIVCNKVTWHLCSAITFTEAIAAALNGVKKEGVSFQLSITGHSLGGWLAQVTAFSVKYLQKDELTFRKIINITDGFHAHAVVFDSPGCAPMLSKIKNKIVPRYEKTIFLERLDITSFLSAPNRINCLNEHQGTICRVLTDLSDVNARGGCSLSYTTKTHSMKKMRKALEANPDMFQMLDWPLRTVLEGREFDQHHERVDHAVNYHRQTERYVFKTIDKNCCNLSIFSEDERSFLDLWEELIKSKLNITNLINVEGLTVGELFNEFEIDAEKQIVTSKSEESINKVIRHTKALMRWIPKEVMKSLALVPSAAEVRFRAEEEYYLRSLKQSRMDFRDTVGLETFLTSGNNILVIRAPDVAAEMARLANIFRQIKETWTGTRMYTSENHYNFMDLKIIEKLQSEVNIKGLFQFRFKDEHLLFIQCIEILDKNFEKILNEILINLKNNPKNKLVFVESKCTVFEDLLNMGNNLVLKRTHEIKLSDLTEAALEMLFDKKIILLQGDQLGLREIAGEYRYLTADQLNCLSESIEPQMFKNLLYSDIKMKEVHCHHDLNVHSTVNKEVSMASVKRASNDSPDALLVVSSIGREQLGTGPWKGSEGENVITAADGEVMFKKKCREKPCANIYWFSAEGGHIHCKAIYKNDFYIKRKFVISKYIFDFVKFSHQTNEEAKMIENSVFVFLNVNDKESLMSRYTISEENKLFILESDHIKTAASEEDLNDIIKSYPSRPVHVLQQGDGGGPILWQRSRGSLEGLRPCVTAEFDDLIDEGDLRDKDHKVVIIADEPGMGKSTTLTSAARLLRPAWVVRVDLKDFPLDSLPSKLCLKSVCKFILRDRDDWLRGLLQFCLGKEHEHSRDIYVCFDGFDEIRQNSSRNVEGEVLRLLEYLNNETTARVWVTTRPHRREILENAFSTFAMQFEKVSEIQQRKFLVTFWHSHLLLETDNYGDVEEKKLDECAECVYRNSKEVLGDDVQNFMGIPLQMRMLADVCLPRVKDYLELKVDIENIVDIKNVLDLYRHFVNFKYDIYFGEKTGLDDRAGGVIRRGNIDQITEKHRMLALRTLFPQFAEEHFDSPEDGWEAELCRVGLVQAGGGGMGGAEFIHRTLAEYYCADLVVEWLRRRGRYHGRAPVVELLLTKLLLLDSYRVIRKFIDNFIISESLSKEANTFGALEISKIWREKQHYLFNEQRRTALHVAVEEGSAGIMELLLGGFRCTPERLIGFLAARDWGGDTTTCNRDSATALGRTARAGCEDMMRKIVESVELCSYEVILELLLATYVGYSSVSAVEIKLLSNYLQNTVVSTQIENAFSRTTTIIQEHIPAFLTAVRAGSAARVGALCREVASGTEMLYCLLGAHGGWWQTPLHRLTAAPHGEEAAILAHISTVLHNQTISAVGRSYMLGGQTPLHLAAGGGRLGLVDWLISHGVWVDSPGGGDGETALWRAAGTGRLAVAQYLIGKEADIYIINNKGENILFTAACGGSLPLLQYLIDKGLDVNRVNNSGESILHYAHPQVRDFLAEQMAQQGGVVGMCGTSAEEVNVVNNA